MKESKSEGRGDWERDVLLGLPPLLNVLQLRSSNALLAPIGLGLMLALVTYFPTFCRPLALFSLAVWPPLTVWSIALWVWARHRLRGAESWKNRKNILEVAGAALPFQTVLAPVFAVLLIVTAVRFMEDQGILGSTGRLCLLLAYLLFLTASYTVLSGPMVSLELDRFRRRPTTRLGRFMAPGMPNFTAMAICGVILSTVLVRIGGAELFVIACALLLAVYLAQACVANLERWRRFRRFMRAEREETAARTTG